MSFPLLALPRCVALRSKHNNSYLRSVHDDSHGGSLIELSAPDGGVMNPRCRFYLEPSKEHEGLVHIRCCYNNKYWVPQQRVLPGAGGGACWVIGTTDEPEEDQSKPSCTLHKLIPIDGEQAEEGSTCRFHHSQLGKYACVSSTSFTSIRSYMHIPSQEEADCQDGGLVDAFIAIDVSDKKQLPSYLVFKGDNGRFLRAAKMPLGNATTLVFAAEDIGDPTVLNTTFTNDDGVVRIHSSQAGKFWSRNQSYFDYIFAGSDYFDKNPDTLFNVISIGDDIIALRNMGNNKICKRFTAALGSGLCAADESITQYARLQCYEPVISREIYDVDFRLNEARMYTTGINGLHSQTVKNHGSTTQKSTLSFRYRHTEDSTWSSTVSLKIGIKTTLVAKVPFFAEASIEVGYEFSGSYTWGKTVSKEEEVTKIMEVNVPPRKKVTVKAIGSNGVCNIPFSYKQEDVLINGVKVIQQFRDGMYYGVKTSNVTFEIEEEDLRADED